MKIGFYASTGWQREKKSLKSVKDTLYESPGEVLYYKGNVITDMEVFYSFFSIKISFLGEKSGSIIDV